MPGKQRVSDVDVLIHYVTPMPPTTREVSDLIGMCRNGAAYRIKTLIERGLLERRVRGHSRGTTLTSKGAELLRREGKVIVRGDERFRGL